MNTRLTYYLTQNRQETPIRAAIIRLREITPLTPDQWEICLPNATAADIEIIRAEFSETQISSCPASAGCGGQYIIPLTEKTSPANPDTIASLISHLDADSDIGAAVGKIEGGNSSPSLPTLVHIGATAVRKSTLDRVGGLSSMTGSAADYDLTFRILAGKSRIDHREDILFQAISATDSPSADSAAAIEPTASGEGSSSHAKSPLPRELALSAREMADRLAVIERHLPPNLSKIYWQDWAQKYKALASHAGRKRDGHLGMILARVQSIHRAIAAPEPVSAEIVESIFCLREQAAIIGDWARRASVWRVILADFSDNLWGAYNACRSSGLQLRCIADNNKAYENLSYRDLPIVPADRAFEGGGIDGVVLTSTTPERIESAFRSLRNHFHGPILRLNQPAKQATHARAVAA